MAKQTFNMYNNIMKVKNDNYIDLDDFLKTKIHLFRDEKKFNAEKYIEQKTYLLNKYMTNNNLNTCVIAISGGIDSSIVLALAVYASKQKKSPIKKIIPITIPSFYRGVSNQKESIVKAKLLCNFLNVDLKEINLTETHKLLSKEIESNLLIEGDDWSIGQMAPTLRTTSLYYVNSLNWSKDHRSVILGTINKSEGSLIGYMGKSGDAMVDIQLISDIYKSEVYSVANKLKIPLEILNSKPTGDMFDARTDEEVFGTSYDALELFLICKEKNIIINNLIFDKISENLNKLIKHNNHKYLSGSPAVHLDIFKNEISTWGNLHEKEFKIPYKKIINLKNIFFDIQEHKKTIELVKFGSVKQLRNVFNESEIKSLLEKINKESWVEVGRSGYRDDKTKGSFRLSFFNEFLSEEIFNRIKSNLDYLVDSSRVDSIAKLFRCIKYDTESELIEHVDESFKISESKSTLFSVVIYLTEGATYFEEDIKINASAGDILIFPHHLKHSFPKGQEKIVIRTDLVYQELIK